jgi:hypothetical protein
MIGPFQYGRKGQVISPRSAYQPSAEVRLLTVNVKQAFGDGEAVQNMPLREYNGRSFLKRAEDSQHTWLSHPDAPYSGDDEWRWNGVRPITRNRVIAVAARLTAQLLYPRQFAQNDQQEEDRNAAYAMDCLVEHFIRHSNYETAFLFGVIASLVKPLNFLEVEYTQSWQELWINGKREQVIDDVFSGLQFGLTPPDEILFGNAYVYDWQKQPWIINKKRISFEEAEGKYSKNQNWGSVKKGVICMASDDGYFYDVQDTNDDLVGEVCYKHRQSDTELYFVNGVYLGNPNTEYNPFYHRTNKDKPKYNSVKFGFEPIDEMRFAGYKSLVDKMENDQDGADRQWQDFFDASRLSTFPPTVTMGAGKVDKSVVAPSGMTEIGKSAKFQTLNVANPAAAAAALMEAERSATESSTDPQASGMQQGPQKTKGEVVTLEENTDVTLSMPAKMIARMVKEAGSLMVDDIIRYETVGEAGELIGQMNYKSFILDGRIKEGRNISTHIKFTDRFAGESMSKDERSMEEYKMMSDAGDDKEILEVNPYVFSHLDWYTITDADELLRRNDKFERAFKVSVFEKAVNDTLVQQDPEAHQKILRDFLFEPLMRGDASKYLPKIQKVAQTIVPGMPGQQDPNDPGNGYPQNDMSSRVVAQGAMGRMV